MGSQWVVVLGSFVLRSCFMGPLDASSSSGCCVVGSLYVLLFDPLPPVSSRLHAASDGTGWVRFFLSPLLACTLSFLCNDRHRKSRGQYIFQRINVYIFNVYIYSFVRSFKQINVYIYSFVHSNKLMSIYSMSIYIQCLYIFNGYIYSMSIFIRSFILNPSFFKPISVYIYSFIHLNQSMSIFIRSFIQSFKQINVHIYSFVHSNKSMSIFIQCPHLFISKYLIYSLGVAGCFLVSYLFVRCR